MEVNVSQYGRNQATLGCPFLTRTHHSVLHYPCLEEPPKDAQKPWVGYAVLQEAHQMVVTDMVENPFDVRFLHPLSMLIGNDLRHPP